MNFDLIDYLQALIFPVVLSIPSFIIIFGGIGFSVFQYKKHPKISLPTIIALSIYALLNVYYVLQPLLNLWLVSAGTETLSISYIYGTIGTVISLVGAIALGILIFAVWRNREETGEL